MTIIRVAPALILAASLPFSAPALAVAKKENVAAPVAVAAPPAGKSQIVFWRPGGIGGAAIRCTVRENGAMIGRIGPGKYFVHTVDPGAHKFTTKTEKTDELNIEAEPDETQFVKCKIGMGIGAGRPNLSASNKAEFDAKAGKLKPVNAEEMAKDIAEDAAERAAGTAQ